jgi:hypothetical protein
MRALIALSRHTPQSHAFVVKVLGKPHSLKYWLRPCVTSRRLFKLLISRQLLISRPHRSFIFGKFGNTQNHSCIIFMVTAKIITTKLTTQDIKSGQVGLTTQKLLAPALLLGEKRGNAVWHYLV